MRTGIALGMTVPTGSAPPLGSTLPTGPIEVRYTGDVPLMAPAPRVTTETTASGVAVGVVVAIAGLCFAVGFALGFVAMHLKAMQNEVLRRRVRSLGVGLAERSARPSGVTAEAGGIASAPTGRIGAP